MGRRFKPNPLFFKTLKLRPDIDMRVEAVAEEVLEIAKATAPVDEGEYVDSLRMRLVNKASRRRRVESTDPKAKYLEWGTSDTPKFATLRNAALRVSS